MRWYTPIQDFRALPNHPPYRPILDKMSETDLWRDRNKVFVAGLPSYVDDDALYEKFKSFGEMFQSKVIYDAKTGRSKGFGFITFREYVNALDAVNQMNQTKWDKRVLNVRFLDPKNGVGASKGDTSVKPKPKKIFGPRPENCTTLYVGNLSYDITEEILRKVFEKCGSVRAIRFAQHIQTGEFRGFGYVQFHDGDACEKALEFDGMVVMGRPMSIDYETKDETTTKAREDLQKKLKKGICHKFQKGECTRGDDCKFAHILEHQDAEDILAGNDPEPTLTTSTTTQHHHEHHDTERAASGSEADPDAPVCINFQKGKCKRGNKCRFLHLAAAGSADDKADADKSKSDEHTVQKPGASFAASTTSVEGANADVAAASTSAPAPDNNSDAPVCINFQKGKCKRGTKCRFLHLEAKDTPNTCDSTQTPSIASSPAEDDASVAAPACMNFQKGKCKRGSACRYRHAEGEATPSATISAPATGSSTTSKRVVLPEVSVCLNFQAGYCSRGANCRFAHTATGSNATDAAAVVLTNKTEYQKRFQSVCYNWQNTKSCSRGDNCPFDHDGVVVRAHTTGSCDATTPKKRKATSELDRVDSEATETETEDEEMKEGKKSKKEKKNKKSKKENKEKKKKQKSGDGE